MTITVSVQEAAQQFFALVESVQKGEDVIITQNDLPIVRMVSVKQASDRPVGIYAGKFSVPDDFNAPLPDDFTGLSA